MSVSMIAAVGRNLELGKNNDLIWHFKEDMKFFKDTTMGHTVVMGRKTFESLPKALPGRKNIVISSNSEYQAQGATVVTSVDEALRIADNLYLTEIDDECPDADTYFPQFNKADYIKEIINYHNIDGTEFYHVVYKK